MNIPPDRIFYQDALPGGAHWSLRMKRGTALRLIDREGGANVGMTFHNPVDVLERYNMPDTLKAQHTFRLTAGHCLYSDMGRIFCSITADTHGWHDTVCGVMDAATVTQKFGERTYAEARNDYHRNGRDSMLVELAKYGMGERDLLACVNWFSKVTAEEDGTLSYVVASSPAGAYVDLRFEMDTLVLFHTCPHPLHPGGAYPRHPVDWIVYRADPVAEDDACRTACPENGRGFLNTDRYNLAGDGA